jgi:hypothetical protein
MKVVKAIALLIVLSASFTACNRVKCPTDTFNRDEIKQLNQPPR